MKTIKLFTYALCILFLGLASCSTDGEDGMDGAQGPQGIAGQDGQDGEDGNANVTGTTIDPFPDWQAGSFLGTPSNVVEIDDADLTEAVVEDALVLMYFQLFGNNVWYPMTFNFPLSNGSDQVITFTYEPELIKIYSLDSGGALDAGITKARYFVIPTQNASGRSMVSRDSKLRSLEEQGVNINNYEEVAAWFNLED